MERRIPVAAAKRRPSETFGLGGGLFAAVFVGAEYVRDFLSAGDVAAPSSGELLLVGGTLGFLATSGGTVLVGTATGSALADR